MISLRLARLSSTTSTRHVVDITRRGLSAHSEGYNFEVRQVKGDLDPPSYKERVLLPDDDIINALSDRWFDRADQLSGILPIYKPRGVSSAYLTRLIRNMLSSKLNKEYLSDCDSIAAELTSTPYDQKDMSRSLIIHTQKPKVRIGHGGTLDPMAEGVLVIGVNGGTKLLDNQLSSQKSYIFEARFGDHYDTYDSTGQLLESASAEHVTKEAVDELMAKWLEQETIEQVPPMFSALHHKGKRLYELAREGKEVERPPRVVHLEKFNCVPTIPQYELSDDANRVVSAPPPKYPQSPPTMSRVALVKRYEQMDEVMYNILDNMASGEMKEVPALQLPEGITAEVSCSGGCYVRSLIVDMAEALGTKAHMSRLVRTKAGPFTLEQSLMPADWSIDSFIKFLNRPDHPLPYRLRTSDDFTSDDSRH